MVNPTEKIGTLDEDTHNVEYRGTWNIGNDSDLAQTSGLTLYQRILGTDTAIEFESPRFADGLFSFILEINPKAEEEEAQVVIYMIAHQQPSGISQSCCDAGWALAGSWNASFTIECDAFEAPLEGMLSSDCYSAFDIGGCEEARIGSIEGFAQYCQSDGSMEIGYTIEGHDQPLPKLEEAYDPTGHLLFNNPQFCDVAFKVQGSYILAVKDLLIQRSAYFSTLFESGFSESTNTVDVDPNQLLIDYPPPPRENYDDDDMTPFEDKDTRSNRSTKEDGGEPASEEERPCKRAKRDINHSRSVSAASTGRTRPMLVVTVPDTRYYTYRALIGYLHCRLLPFTASPSHYHASDPDSFNPHNLARRYGEPIGDRATWSKRQYDALSEYVPPEKLWPASPHAIYRLADRYDLEEVKILAKRRITDDLEDWTAAFELYSPLSLDFPDIQDEIFDYVCRNFTQVKESEAFRTVLDKIHSGELVNAKELTGRLFSAVLKLQQ